VSVSTQPRAALPEDGVLHSSVDALALIPHAMAVKYGILPRRIVGTDLHVAIPDASDEALLDRVRSITGKRVQAVAASREDLRRAIARAYAVDAPPVQPTTEHQAPAVMAIDAMHDTAIERGASDIHIEPDGDGGRVRLRVDGMLHEAQRLSPQLYAPVVSRIKLLASMDIAERRQAQDGRYSLSRADRSLDARVSSMPTFAGEKLVIRLLDLQAAVPSLEELGMAQHMLAAYRRMIHAPGGFIVVCGPTGSGKTTTMYASMAERNTENLHLCSIEDPVEVAMPGIAQIQVNPRAGVTFASALRALLRQDPNVVMLGEIRDADSAAAAISAALSGQLVLTSLHATDAPRAIERLVELGVSRQRLAIGLTGIVSQRLVRRLCPVCRRRVALDLREASWLGLPCGIPVFDEAGCDRCAGGFRGRVGIFELLPVTEGVRNAMSSQMPLRDEAFKAGYRPLLESAAAVVSSAATSLSEVKRVLGDGRQ
jgi:type II secretory ATPase GspE/PulE/Tfp pilus assembly ATPase PilB-like protein